MRKKEDLLCPEKPSRADLKVLDRLGDRRSALEAREPADEEEAIVRTRALAQLDDMEECLVEEGRNAPFLLQAWQVLDDLEARLNELQANRDGEPSAPKANNVVPIRRPSKPARPFPGMPLALIA